MRPCTSSLGMRYWSSIMKQLLSSPDFLLSLEQVGIRLVNLISKAFLSSAVAKGIVREIGGTE
ncbi:hypothetical protein PACILC2_33290 [Paenibacillus cisolokensis]|uniref:Uncharacterized protein n=1 Tax=Paenibacillus cisolokensis TaxID=1658519 RepID=A0ABQ4N9A4_9BACL|nr:hypothetical protein PACILC2_33290 [Paenibacillus cisolokensis]